MKEVKLLTEWAEGVVEANSFSQPKRMGTPMSSKADRPLPRNIDIQYKAQRAHPELSPEQALAMYMNDELVDKEKMDFAQNKLINRVKGENEKLTRTVSELGKELHDFEQHSQDTDREVERLKTLSAKLKPAGDVTKQVAQATSQQIEKMMKDVEELRLKPGMTPDKQKELEQKINDIKTGGLSSDEIDNINKTLGVLTVKQEVDDQMFNQVMGKLEKTQDELERKEKRFQKSIRGNAEKIKSWGNRFSDLDKQIAKIEKRADAKLAQIDQATEEADETLNRISAMVRQMNPQASQPVTKALSNIDDKEEVQQAMTTPSATTLPPATEPMDDYDDVAVMDEPEEDYTSISDLLNKYRKPTNVKKSGQLGEQIEMQEPEDEMETKIIPWFVRRYARTYPNDLRIWSEEQIESAIRETVDRHILIWQPNVDEQRINTYIAYLHKRLRKNVTPANPELPGISDEPSGSIQESLFKEFEKSITQITRGY